MLLAYGELMPRAAKIQANIDCIVSLNVVITISQCHQIKNSNKESTLAKKYHTFTHFIGILAIPMLSSVATAETIDNDKAPSDVGYLSVDVTSGGEASSARITAVGNPSGTLFQNTDILFSYRSFIDVGASGEGTRLLESSITDSGITLENSGVSEDFTRSTGSFIGASGNVIGWSVISIIADDSSTMANIFQFTARTGTLGELRLYQSIDQDVLNGSSSDVFFSRGDADSGNLELFTADIAEAIGMSQAGPMNEFNSLFNATFTGWAACTFNNIEPQIENGTLQISRSGEICSSLAQQTLDHPILGPVLGPADLVSTLAWNVDPNARYSIITTTLNLLPPLDSNILPPVFCNGLPITVDLALGQTPTTGDDVILGTEGDDTIRALDGHDTICGLGGNDLINAGGGNDFVDAGPGHDRVFGISGDDELHGGSGADRMFGGPGEDIIYGDNGNDRLNGGGGSDLIFGGNGNDEIFGQFGNDLLMGDDGDDLINGAAGDDYLVGGNGSDRLVGDLNDSQAGDDLLDGGPGADVLVGRAGDNFCFIDSADTVSGCNF